MVGRMDIAINKDAFSAELFTDASSSFGIGGVYGLDTLSLKWQRNTIGEHIGSLELEAVFECLHHWRHDLHGQSVLVRVDNIQAVVAINKGASRKPALCDTLLKIALLGLKFKFELRALHVKGSDNPADAPSRGRAKTSTQDYTFAWFRDFNFPPATVDCCAAESGYNVQPGCSVFFSSARPMQEHISELVGKTLWANIPFAEAGKFLEAIVDAWSRDPVHTIATCVVPDWKVKAWYMKYLRRKNPLFRVLFRFPRGSRVFKNKNTRDCAQPCPFPVLVIRLGGNVRDDPIGPVL